MLKANDIKMMKGKVLVSEIEKGFQTKNGIIVPDDNMKERGIRPRWCKVFAVADDVNDIEEGMWVLVEHGDWTRGFEADLRGSVHTYRLVNDQGILGFQWEKPSQISTE